MSKYATACEGGGFDRALRRHRLRVCESDRQRDPRTPIPLPSPPNKKRPVSVSRQGVQRGRAVDSLWGVRGWTFPREMTNPPPLRNLVFVSPLLPRSSQGPRFRTFVMRPGLNSSEPTLDPMGDPIMRGHRDLSNGILWTERANEKLSAFPCS